MDLMLAGATLHVADVDRSLAFYRTRFAAGASGAFRHEGRLMSVVSSAGYTIPLLHCV
jgi:hypothetical protein